jgi:cytochrome c553
VDQAVRTMRLGALLALTLASATAAAEGTVEGDPSKAEPIVGKVCVACHGADGNSLVPLFPKLAGQVPEYILKQLTDFKKKKRTADAMNPVVADLSEEDMANLALFFAAKKAAPGTVKQAGLLDAGKKVYSEGDPGTGVPACAGCHGVAGAGTARFPRLAGQHPDYVIAQLKLFAKGDRRNDKRAMQAIADRLSEEEMKAVAEYITSLP